MTERNYISNLIRKENEIEIKNQLVNDKFMVPNDLTKEEFEKRNKIVSENNIRSDTDNVFFWLGENTTKEHKIAAKKINIRSFATGDHGKKIQDIGALESEDIDYDYVKNNEINKVGGKFNFYKDGVLLILNDNPHDYHHLEISSYLKDSYNEESNSYWYNFLTINKTVVFSSYGDLTKLKQFNNELNIYIVFTKAYKNKAFKLTMKNNIHFKSIINRLEGPYQKEYDVERYKGMFEAMPSKILNEYLIAQAVSDEIISAKTFLETETGVNVEKFKKEIANFNNQTLLKSSYYTALSLKISILIQMLSTVYEADTERWEKILNKESDFDQVEFTYKLFADVDMKSGYEITKRLFKILDEADINLESMKNSYNNLMLDEREMNTEDGFSEGEVAYHMYQFIALSLFTKEGTHIPNVGPIKTENASKIDCYMFWTTINNFNLLNSCLETDQFPAILEEGKLISEQNFNENFDKIRDKGSSAALRHPLEKINFEPDTKKQIQEILNEAMDQSTGLWVPYNACVEIKDDPIFKYIRFIEYEKVIAMFVTDHNERYLFEIFSKEKRDFKYWLFNSGTVYDEKIDSSSSLIYLKLASCIRDWKVLIERDSTMNYRGRKVPTGSSSDKKRIIYLPITKYKRNPDSEQLKKERVFFDKNKKFNGERRAHTRLLPEGHKASKFQLILASNLNIPIPPNHTFVNGCEWGKKSITQKEKTYRSKSLNGLFYASDYEVEKVKEIHELSPAGFEERMEEYVSDLGWKVIKRNNYDGGIDIRALKEQKDGSTNKLLVQCKHWKRPVGPKEIRELWGAAGIEDSEYKKELMFITTARYTSGAKEVAEKFNIKLIEGDDLI